MSAAAQAVIVADLGFGDAGKGTLTDWLVRRLGASWVVRYNGGAQAGHTVVTEDGRSHTFAQFGAGSFVPGVRTHLSRFMLVHPGGLLAEAEALARVGVADGLERLSIDPEALIISPFLQAAGRLRELGRGAARHGSCGIGVGETMQDALEHPQDSIRAIDLSDASTLRMKLQRQQARKWEEFGPERRLWIADPQGKREWAVLESLQVGQHWIELAARLASRVGIVRQTLAGGQSVVFEGAQGVLLDEWRGFHPHTTWSTCTFQNALDLLKDWPGEVIRLGVLRSYATRHGAGPFPTEDPQLQFPESHNHHGPWQGAFRQGWPDAVLTRYAIAACGGVDALALTHCDRLDRTWRLAKAYQSGADLALGPHQDLDYQAGLTRGLQEAQPIYQEFPANRLSEELQQQLQAPIWVESHGPGPKHKRETAVSGLRGRPEPGMVRSELLSR